MRQTAQRSAAHINIIGGGIAGSWQALLFAKAGHDVTLFERGDASMQEATSYWAGGMLAPWCEAESTEPVVTRLGARSLRLWRDEFPETSFNGSLVVAHPRDRTDFDRFAKLTTHHSQVDAIGIAKLEPALDGRFREGLFFFDEGHVEPRPILRELHRRLTAGGTAIHFRSDIRSEDLDSIVIDCRGLAARDKFPDLRGVKGEVIVLESDEISLSRPVRLIHPRWPLYIVPRHGNQYFIGATTIESENDGVSVRSVLELLTAVYAVHPVFAEARIVEIGAGLRPAFPTNLPRIAIDGELISVNGLYRHGFLLAPALAELTVAYVQRGLIDNEVMECV
jgi:glycine oxidase